MDVRPPSFAFSNESVLIQQTMMTNLIATFVVVSVLLGACSSGNPSNKHSDFENQKALEPVYDQTLGWPGDDTLTTAVANRIHILSAADYSFDEETEFCEVEGERVLFKVFEKSHSSYIALVQDSEGATIRTVFESGLKRGINQISFRHLALGEGTYRWLMMDRLANDTVQYVEFSVSDIP
jgi:hypothetical protein